MERPSFHSRLHSQDLEEHPAEAKKNRWAAAGQAVLNPSLQKEQNFPSSMGRSHFPRSPMHADDMLAVLASRGVAAVGKPTTAADLHAFWVFLLS